MLSFKSICNCSRFGCSYDVSTGRRYCTGLTRTWRRRFSGGKMLWTLWSWAILGAYKSCISTEPGDFGAWGFQTQAQKMSCIWKLVSFTKMAFDGRYTKISFLSRVGENSHSCECNRSLYMQAVHLHVFCTFYLSFKSSNVHDVFLFFMFLDGQQRHFHFTMPFVNLILHFFLCNKQKSFPIF